MESNNSPEISERGETSDISGLPSGEEERERWMPRPTHENHCVISVSNLEKQCFLWVCVVYLTVKWMGTDRVISQGYRCLVYCPQG